jgi:hypothetical protein
MKRKLMFLLLLSSYTISAQLTITPGAQFSIFSDTKLTLQNTDLINNGNFLAATTSPVSFTGNASSFIGGDQAILFFKLEINKTGNQTVSLQKKISVVSNVFFTSGFLNLNGFDLDLETTGRLAGEQENSRVVGSNGGNVIFSTNLDMPTNFNPANLGVFITSGQNLGNVTIRRGHQSQPNIPGSGRSVLRYYDILPGNNTDLNATLRLNYFDGELNGIEESSLVLFKSNDGANWLSQGFTSKDPNANFVERTGIGSFSKWTLSNDSNPLPVRFILFNAICQSNNVLLTWKTAQEQNSSHFDIERSINGTNWTVIGNLPAAGNSSIERSYSFTDNSPVQNGFYRVAQYDLDGKVQYTSILHSSCTIADAFRLWPNPVDDVVFINIVSSNASQAVINLFDSKGALVKLQRVAVIQGSNQVSVDMKSMAAGMYSLSVYWNNGQTKKTVQLLKQ